MNWAGIVSDVEKRIEAGEAYIEAELDALYAGVGHLVEQGRNALESELSALKEIANRIFGHSAEVPPSSETVSVGEPDNGSQVGGPPVAEVHEASAPTDSSALEAADLTGLPASEAEAVIEHPVELHQLADDGNPHHEDSIKGAAVEPPHDHEEGHTGDA